MRPGLHPAPCMLLRAYPSPTDPLTDHLFTLDACLRRDAVLALRPARFKGKAPRSITISSTTGPGVKLDHRLWTV